MRHALTALIAMSCLAFLAAGSADAQVPKTFIVGFGNQTNMNVIVKGYTVVNGVQRSGPTLQLLKNGMAFENNVPAGIRYYTVYDANYKILLRDHAVLIQTRNVALDIVPVLGNPNRVLIVPAQ